MSRNFKAQALKTFALSWLRFDRAYDLVCSEDPHRNADAIGVDSEDGSTRMTEIEVKVDMSDLKADIKKTTGRDGLALTKHEAMVKIGEDEGKLKSSQPTQFYFLVPTEMLEKAKPYILENHPHAGILHANPNDLVRYKYNPIRTEKRAKVLHKLPISKVIKRAILMRGTSELCNALIEAHRQAVGKLESQNETDEVHSDQ
jgi:hypothetical protein